MMKEWQRTLSKYFLIPQRYVLGIMGFLAVVNAYTMRICLSVAITEMTGTGNSTNYNVEGGCPDPEYDDDHHLNDQIKPILYDWSESVQGQILGSFYWGYIITHLPGGILAEKYGGKYTLGLGILSTSIFTILTPFVVVLTDGSYQWLVVLRVLQGLGEGTTYPALNTMLGKWVPAHERSKLGTLVYAGGQIGTVVGNAFSGLLIEATGEWSSVFYVFGGIGVIWFIFWTLLCYSEPDSHPFITDQEKTYLRYELAGSADKKSKKTPWKAIVTSVPLWALVCAQIGHDWGFYTMVTDLPKYMADVLKFSVSANGIWSSLPYILMWIVSMLSGWLCDWLIVRRYMGITCARKFFTTVASIGPGIFMIAASYAGCDRIAVISLFTIAMGFMGTFYCGMKVNALDLAPNYAGTLMAIINGIGAFAGMLSPTFVGAVTENHTVDEWRLVFWVSVGVFLVSNVVYVLFASGEEQWWNNPSEETKENVERYSEKLETIELDDTTMNRSVKSH